MAPPRKPVPPGFAVKYLELGGQFKGPGGIADFYAVDDRTARRWASEVFTAEVSIDLAEMPKGRPAEMLKERDLDPQEWIVERATVNEWTMADGDLATQTRLTVRPREQQIRSARVDGWKRPAIRARKPSVPELAVICGDQHAPLHDRDFHAKFLAWLSEHTPTRGVILGDLLENANISRWRDRKGEATVEQSLDAAYDLLRDYIHASPDTDWQWIEGNHDERVTSYAEGNAPKLADIHRAGEVEPVLSMPHLMRLDELKVKYVGDYPLGKVKLAEKLYVAHGNLAKKGAGATALANLEKRGYSIITGHTHRAGIVFKTVLDEDDKPSTLVGAETGTMLKIAPKSYDIAPDWQNTFITATIWRDGHFHLEPAVYSAGSLRWRDCRY